MLVRAGDIVSKAKPCFRIANAYGLHAGCFCSLSVVVYLLHEAADQARPVGTFLSVETNHKSNDDLLKEIDLHSNFHRRLTVNLSCSVALH